MQETCDAALARGRDDDFGAVEIHGVEIIFFRQPHPWKSRKVINLTDVAERLIHQVRIEHRTFDILHVRQQVRRRKKIEYPHLLIAGGKRRYQVLSDKPAAASDEDPGHECRRGST